jgi:hypothetical protein
LTDHKLLVVGLGVVGVFTVAVHTEDVLADQAVRLCGRLCQHKHHMRGTFRQPVGNIQGTCGGRARYLGGPLPPSGVAGQI